MDSVRRCEDCRRIIGGNVGDACPYCGGAHLARLSVALRPGVQRHTSVLTAVITFCLGLSLLRVLFLCFGPRLTIASSGYSELLWQLQVLVTIVTLIYVVLRRGEGDFRALAIISVLLFVTTEVISSLLHAYGLIMLRGPSILFNMALLIYSSLALTAAMADGPRRDAYGKCLVAAVSGFMFSAALRTFLEMRGHDDSRGNWSLALLFSVMAVYMGVILIRNEFSFRMRESAPSDASTPSLSNPHLPAADKPAQVIAGEDPRLKL